jgi:hypothetical protein
MIIFFCLLVALVGFLMYSFCSNAKLQHLGDVFLWCGVFVFLFYYCAGGHSVNILGH